MAESIGSLNLNLSANTARLEADLGRLSKFVGQSTAAMQKSFQKLGREMSSVGKEFSVKLTLPIVGIGTAATVAAARFEESMSKIIGLVGVAKDQVKAWEKDLKKIGPTTGKSMQELGDALFFITSAGLKGSEAIQVLEASAKASAAGLGEVKVIADLATSAMNAWGKETLPAIQATDILTAAVREGKAEATDFAGALGSVFPIASKMGVSFGEVAGSIAAMTRTGSDANEATTQLSQIMVSIAKPAKQAEEAMKALGTSSSELRRKIKEEGLLAALLEINDLTRKFGIEAVAQVFPNIRAFKGALDLLGESVETNRKIIEAVVNSAGATQKAFDEAAQAAGFLWNVLKAQLNVTAVTLGNEILPAVTGAMRKMIEQLAKATESFSNMAPMAKSLALAFAGIAAAIGPVMVAIGGMLTLLGGPLSLAIAGTVAAIAAIGFIAVKAADNWDTLTTATNNFKNLADQAKGSTENLTSKYKLLSAAVDESANPWTSAIAKTQLAKEKMDAAKPSAEGLASAMGGLKTETSKLSEAWGNAQGPMDGFFGSLVDWFKKVAEVSPAAQNALKATFNKQLQEQQKLREEYIKSGFEIDGQIAGNIQMRKTMEDLTRSFFGIHPAIKRSTAAAEEINESFSEAEKGTKKLSEAAKRLKKELEEQVRVDKSALDSVNNLADSWKEQADTIFLTTKELRQYTLDALAAKLATEGLSQEGLAQLQVALQRAREELERLNIREKFANTLQMFEDFDPFEQLTDSASKSLTAIQVFAADIASNINDAFANTLTELVFDFKNFGDAVKSVLRSIANSFFQLISTFATNPLRIALEGSGGGNLNFGNAIGALFGGIGESFRSLGSLALGEFAGFSGFVGTLGAALPAIGLVAGAAVAAVSLITDAFKKTPRLDIDFDSIKTEMGRRAALISEILDPEFFQNEIAQISVKRGGVGLGLGGDEGIKKVIRERLEQIITGIQDIINTLPTELSALLNETLANSGLDISTVVKGERFLEFDAKGKKIAEKFKAFIEGELPAKLFGAIRDSFFLPALEALGVASESAQGLIDKFLSDFQAAGSREARGAVGQQFIEQFAAFIDAFNFTAGRFGDSTSEMIDSIKALANEIGFEGIPSMDQMKAALQEIIQNADIDLEIVNKFKDLRQAIAEVGLSISSTAISLVQFINSLNAKIVDLGGVALDTSGALQQTIDSLVDLIQGGTLGFSQMQQALQQLDQAVSIQLQNELDAARARIQAQQAGIQAEISARQSQLRLIQDKTNAEIDGLEAALRIAENFRNLAERLSNDLRNLFTGSNSVLNAFEKLNFIQAEIARAQQRLAAATTPEGKLEGIEGLQDLQNELINLGSTAFGTASPEFQALFRSVADELQRLVGQAEQEGARVETLQDKIETLKETLQTQTDRLQASIESSQARLASLSSQQVQISGEAAARIRELLEFARDEAAKLLEEANQALADLGVDTSHLNPLEAINAEQLTVLRSIDGRLSNLQGFQHGTSGFRDFGSGTLGVLHGVEGVFRPEDMERPESSTRPSGPAEFNVNIEMNGDASDSTKKFFAKEIVREMKDWIEYGDGRSVVRKIK